ncbi:MULTISPECIES: GH1 family beta-glucosidase [Nocardioides]|uniref:Beta-glucosidase n=1 Tax=Nocardioides vastitatis TaxID=2568655 RepID=A0ABW0ZHK3_9ACTN|nr:GH1 family beta-glucosidase [Nocardioides sp.]THJ06704.1 beta-glucosidase [Nocardioides sp.]
MLPQDLAARFPAGFRFGTATSAQQIEGASTADGRGSSIWDTFAAGGGRILDGSTSETACDHFHRYPEDVALLKELAAPTYRMSISWSRIQPTGRGPANGRGLDFYDRVVDAVLEAGVRPMVTLHHWDLPQGLEDDGGWLNRDTAARFADYAAAVGDRLADRVGAWVPMSEPAVVAYLGYGTGEHAPGRTLMFDALPVAHHLLLAHGGAVIALRAAGAAEVGCAHNHAPMWPASDDPADVGATKLFDALWNGLFLESTLLGRYPQDLAPLLEDVVQPGDLATIRQPLDFYGVNYYSPLRIAAARDSSLSPFQLVEVLGRPRTESGWAVVPEALQEWLIMTRARYRAALPPIVITECGAAYDVAPLADGTIDDSIRIEYLSTHLQAVANAIAAGVDVRGFYVWSLLDCWEFEDGFSPRYGLVHVDPETQQRTPKRSFHWYGALVAAHRSVHPATADPAG